MASQDVELTEPPETAALPNAAPTRRGRQLLWYLALLVLVLAGDRLGGYLLKGMVEQSQFRYSRLYNGSAGADILLVGNSRGLTFYQPYIEEVTGKKTYNLSYNGLPMDAARVLVEDYLDHYPAPQLMVIDITTCDRVNDELVAGFLPYADYSRRLDHLIHRKLPKVWWGGQVSWLFRYNNELFQRAFFHHRRTDADWMLDRVISPDLAAAAGRNSYDLEIHPDLIGELKATVEAARARGVRVELVIGPYFPAFAPNVKNLDRLKSEVETATGLPVRDYRQALSDPAAFGDFMHPNRVGSMRYIDLLRRDGLLP
jgi:hypothetical protein